MQNYILGPRNPSKNELKASFKKEDFIIVYIIFFLPYLMIFKSNKAVHLLHSGSIFKNHQTCGKKCRKSSFFQHDFHSILLLRIQRFREYPILPFSTTIGNYKLITITKPLKTESFNAHSSLLGY